MKNRYFGFIALTAMFASSALAQDQQVEIKVQEVAGGIYMLEGRGGNIGLSVGEDGVFMIDDQFAPLTEAILDAIAKITDQPVEFVLNTHWHGDHTGGNENLGKAGVLIVAHDNVRERMNTEQVREIRGTTTPASPKDALPVVTFNDSITFHMNGNAILAVHTSAGHTDGDAIVFFQDSNVIHMGDIFFRQRYPFIDVELGGSVDGTIANANYALEVADNNTKIIPGHGSLATRADLAAYRDMLVTVRNAVVEMINQDLSLQEVLAAKPTADYDATWGGGFIDGDTLVSLMYLDLAGEN